MIKISLTDKEIQSAFEFSLKRQDDVGFYVQRCESNLTKIQKDIFVGALGEIAVHKYLITQNVISTSPDFTIYSVKQKSYQADLKVGNAGLHIKTQDHDSTARYGRSWLLQRNDPNCKSPDPDDFLVLCTRDKNPNEIIIWGIYKFSDLLAAGQMMDCAVPKFNVTKCALYMDEIEKASVQDYLKYVTLL